MGPNYVLDKGFLAQATTVQFTAVKFGTTDDSVTPVTGTGDDVLGIAYEACAAADANKRVIDVRILGIARCIAGGSITRGNKVKVTATGTLIATTADADKVVGIAMNTAVSGDQFDVLLTPGLMRAA
jgi:hypothetical protein